MSDARPPQVEALVEHLFRREAGRMVAALTRVFGPGELTLAEDVVQDALMKALDRWPYAGVPDNPSGWLYTVARNGALDRLRRRQGWTAVRHEVAILAESRLEQLPEPRFRGEVGDDQLRLIFVCCHPALRGEDRVALTLKTVCGFGVGEISSALLISEQALSQRLVRAKRRIREQDLKFEMPPPEALEDRLNTVLNVLYLMFNEGYSPSSGDAAIRTDICVEAARMAELVADHPIAGRPQSHALAALLLCHGARLPGRTDAAGELLLLEEQDRDRWDREAISRGMAHLRAAMAGEHVSELHLEAGIAACHVAADSVQDTDWRAILGYYDRLLALAPTPVRALNRAVALAMVDGPHAALSALEQLAETGELTGYYLLPATRGELLRRTGQTAEARAALQQALSLAGSQPSKTLIARRIAALPT